MNAYALKYQDEIVQIAKSKFELLDSYSYNHAAPEIKADMKVVPVMVTEIE